jgi:hypothetical protein
MIVVLLVGAPMLQACQPQAKSEAYTSEDANEDAALNAIREQDNEVEGAGLAVSGMIPDNDGHVPMANVQ